MAEEKSVPTSECDEQELARLREILLGKNYALITDKIKSQARDVVKDVVAEALHDRQKQDNSIDKVLQPIVERSVEQSVSGHSDKLIGYLYPLVGSLVRKSVKAFLTDFIEKTNQLLENSLTIKGLKWRIKARQAGVSFAQYVASQTFVYRVEHLLLIHRETGILLKSVDYNAHSGSNVDLISSMLTAINDFVIDSFSHANHDDEEQLQTVTTDNFTLLIKPGPYAMIVAAVTGNAPHKLSEKMQVVLENIHSLYDDEMRNFQGDTEVFESSDSQLRDCLLAEEKSPNQEKQKKPWFAWILLSFIAAGLFLWIFKVWQSEQLKHQILELNNQSGYMIKSLQVGLDQSVDLEIIRDPDALELTAWLALNQLKLKRLNLVEHLFYSLDPNLQLERVDKIFQKYSTLDYKWQDSVLVVSGKLNFESTNQLVEQLALIGITQGDQLDLSQLQTFEALNQNGNQNELRMQVFLQMVSEINSIQLNFEVAKKEISTSMQQPLLNLVNQYQALVEFSKHLNLKLSLVLIGTSDNSGNLSVNNKLSIERAVNTKNKLVELGMNKDDIYTSGIGQINLENVDSSAEWNTRKVLINVMYIDMDKTNYNKTELVPK